MEWLESLVLGLVQGITEFLPVSSDGHLAVTQQAFGWLTGRPRSGEQDLFFDVMLHVGTLAAILVHYRHVIVHTLRGLRGGHDSPPGFERSSLVHVGVLAAVATSPLVPFALFFKDKLEQMFQSSQAAAYGFLVTAVVLVLVSLRLKGPEGRKGPAETSLTDALLIGVAQMFAPLPGVSRSGLTIASALGLGFTRAWAVGFSLLIAIPAISGAAVFELKHMLKDPQAMGMTVGRLAQTLGATIVAGLVGYAAILWLIRVVRAGKLWYFSVYLVALAIIILAAVSMSRGAAHADHVTTVDRSPRGPSAETPLVRGRQRPGLALDRAHIPGSRPGHPRARGISRRQGTHGPGPDLGGALADDPAGVRGWARGVAGAVGSSRVPRVDSTTPG